MITLGGIEWVSYMFISMKTMLNQTTTLHLNDNAPL